MNFYAWVLLAWYAIMMISLPVNIGAPREPLTNGMAKVLIGILMVQALFVVLGVSTAASS